MGEINERRGIGSSGHRNPTNVTLGPESLGSVWDLQPPAGACKFTGHRPANIKGGSLPVNSHSIVSPMLELSEGAQLHRSRCPCS
jgi:hypothetical protein